MVRSILLIEITSMKQSCLSFHLLYFPPAEAEGSFDSFSKVLEDITFTTVVVDLLSALGKWYPDWGSSENTCKNDGSEPGEFHDP